MASNQERWPQTSNGLQPKSDGLQPRRDGLQPKSDGIQLYSDGLQSNGFSFIVIHQVFAIKVEEAFKKWDITGDGDRRFA